MKEGWRAGTNDEVVINEYGGISDDEGDEEGAVKVRQTLGSTYTKNTAGFLSNTSKLKSQVCIAVLNIGAVFFESIYRSISKPY